MNPGFIRAHLLLALLYLNNGNYAKAKVEAEKSLKLDTGNVMAARYLKEAEGMMLPQDVKEAESKEKLAGDVVRYQRDNETIIQPVRTNVFTRSGSIWGIVLGVILGIAVSCFLILPKRIQEMNTSYKTQISEISEESDSKSAKIGEYEQQIEALTSELEGLKNEVSAVEGSDSSNSASNDLMEAVSLYLTDATNIDGIEEKLSKVDLNAMGDEVPAEFNDLYASFMVLVGAELSKRSYDTGYEAYRSADYETAIAFLSKAFQYDNTNVDALYNLGNAYYESGDTDNAKVVYDQVINDFSETRSASSAETKLAEINNATN